MSQINNNSYRHNGKKDNNSNNNENNFDKTCGQYESHHDRAISDAVIKRLPRYYRYLRELLSHGKTRISSAELASIMNVTASQIRQDLNCFGGFGQQGYGYNVEKLYNQILDILGANNGYNAVIIGAGNLGRAIVRSPMFERRGVTVKAMFDSNPALVGDAVAGVTIYPVSELAAYCRSHKVDIAVLTLPKESAADALRIAEDAGVLGIWNFTSNELDLKHKTAIVENVHLGDSLMTLCYRLHSGETVDDGDARD